MYRARSHLNRVKDYKFIAIVITLCVLSGCGTGADSREAAAAISEEAISLALRDSETRFAARANIENLGNAVSILGRVRDLDNRNFEVEWKFAKYSYFLGKAETDETKATEAFERGRDAGRIAARIEKEKPDGHFWFAANLGELAKMSPLTVGLKSVDELRGSMEKVIAVAPDYQGASAFDALGQLEVATRNFKGGKIERAVDYYQKGLTLAPDNSNLRLHLAEAYLSLKRDADARKQLDMLISMKPDQQYALEHELAVGKAREMLSRNF